MNENYFIKIKYKVQMEVESNSKKYLVKTIGFTRLTNKHGIFNCSTFYAILEN